ncbi:methyl-accepting chemotaxis protein [Allopseudospirillum japonicum]|uniref:Methyl-accepting chemotaxis protein n=1 Tax=Allopseudospirillum japonicum TaxID=64971 RepID=A0A1H6RK78_9GAMM|nr:methyl-accepting chemotaxis protein [Allopseudospirillum japonicum]SEI52210.1 methyl-accepting chemotaxis protein [Allopseudospirillum japonicum]
MDFWYSTSLRTRLFINVSLLLLVIFGLSLLMQHQLTTTHSRERVQNQDLPQVLALLSTQIQTELTGPIALSQQLAENSFIHQWLQDGSPQDQLAKIQAHLQQVQQITGANLVFMATGTDQTYYHYSNGTLQHRRLSAQNPDDAWYYRFSQQAEAFELNLDTNHFEGDQLKLFINYRSHAQITREGHSLPVNLAGVGLDMQHLADLIRQYSIGDTGFVFLTQMTGRVDIHPDPKVAGQLTLNALPGFANLAEVMLQDTSGKTRVYQIQNQGHTEYVGVRFIADLQRFLIVQVPEYQILAPVQEISLQLLGLAGILSAVGLLLVYWQSGHWVLPIRSLAKQILHVAQQHDLSYRLHTKDGAEIGELVKDMNQLLQHLQIAITKVQSNSQAMYQASDHLTLGAHAATTAIQQQQVSVTQVAQALTEISQKTHRINTHAQEAAEQATVCQANTQTGRKHLTQSAHTLHQLAHEVQACHHTMSHLAQATNNISHVVDVIQAVSEQTNLLALNAAIESARAGEAGRGFAVVADEVRALAQRTHDSADEIQGLVTELQTQTQDVVQRMHASYTHSQTSVADLELAVTELQEVEDGVQHMNTMNAEIATLIDQQSQQLKTVNQKLQEIAEHSQHTASSAEQATAFTQNIQELTQELQQRTALFKCEGVQNIMRA